MRVVPLFVLSACIWDLGPIGDDWQPVSYVDQGELCFEQQGADVVVSVTAPDCLSSSCSRDFDGSCTAVVDGEVITLTSDIRWEDNQGEGVACTDDCGIPTVSCEIGELPEGLYTVGFGGQTIELAVPVEGACPAL